MYIMSHEDVPEAYKEVAVIGNGAYGTVYRARDPQNNQLVALKKIRVTLQDDGVPSSTMREIALLKQLVDYEHPNIVRLLDICEGKRYERQRHLDVYLVFEHVDMDLGIYLTHCPAALPISKIKNIMFQILSGVDFMHANRMVHRDLKPQNLLVTAEGQVKLADFGLARIYEPRMLLTPGIVTQYYRSPEVLLGCDYSTAVDMWSCGCIMAELYRRTPIFSGHSEVDQLQKIFDVLGTPSEEEWPMSVNLSWTSFKYRVPKDLETLVPGLCPKGKDLLEKMFRFSPTDRVLPREALEHPYFRDDGYVPLAVRNLSSEDSTYPIQSTSASGGRM